MKLSILILLGIPIAFAAPVGNTQSTPSSLPDGASDAKGSKAGLATNARGNKEQVEAGVLLQGQQTHDQNGADERSRSQATHHEDTSLDFFLLNDHQHPSATAEYKALERRDEKVDRRQKDRSKPIDFSLLTPCIEKCFRASNSVAPKSLDVVSLDEFCRNKADWFLWLSFGPAHCWVINCRAKDKHLGPVGKEWRESNCGW